MVKVMTHTIGEKDDAGDAHVPCEQQKTKGGGVQVELEETKSRKQHQGDQLCWKHIEVNQY